MCIRDRSYTLQIWCTRGSWAVLARGPQIGPEVGVAWSTCRISNFWDPSTSVDRMKLRCSNLVRTWILGSSCPRMTNCPASRRRLGNVPNFEISGPLNISGSDDPALFKFGAHMDPRLFLPAHYKLVPKSACPGARDPVSKL